MIPENNYTQIPNIILDNMEQFSGGELKVIFAIARKTIGWRKQTDKISYSQIALVTGLATNSIRKSIDSLVTKGWLIRSGDSKRGYIYGLNIVEKQEESETAIAESDTALYQKMIQPVSKNDTILYQKMTPQKKKETNQNKIKEKENNHSQSEASRISNRWYRTFNERKCVTRRASPDNIKRTEDVLNNGYTSDQVCIASDFYWSNHCKCFPVWDEREEKRNPENFNSFIANIDSIWSAIVEFCEINNKELSELEAVK